MLLTLEIVHDQPNNKIRAIIKIFNGTKVE